MSKESQSSGLGLLSVLQVVFFILKLTGLIDWSWWLVLVPLWVDIGFGLLFIMLAWIIYKS